MKRGGWTTTNFVRFLASAERAAFLVQPRNNFHGTAIWTVALTGFEIWLLAHRVPAWLIRPWAKV